MPIPAGKSNCMSRSIPEGCEIRSGSKALYLKYNFLPNSEKFIYRNYNSENVIVKKVLFFRKLNYSENLFSQLQT